MNVDRRPPVLAVWLLSRLVRGSKGEALMGDLAEEYQRGRTHLWYWGQALWAAASDLREYPRRRLGLGALRVLIIASLIVGASLGATWPLFILVLDPTWWYLARRRRRCSEHESLPGHFQ